MAEKPRGIWEKIEEKWYSFLDWCEEKNIPIYKAADWFDEKGISSLVVFIGIFLLLFGGILAFFLFSGTSTTKVMIYVHDNTTKKPITPAEAYLEINGEKYELKYDEGNKYWFATVPKGKAKLIIKKDGYDEYEKELNLKKDEFSYHAYLNKIKEMIKKTIKLIEGSSYDNATLFSEKIEITYSCTNTNYEKTATVENGLLSVEVPEDCGQLIITTNDPEYSLENQTINLEEENPQIKVEKGEETKESNYRINVYVIDKETSEPIEGLNVVLYELDEYDSYLPIDECKTDESGSCSFSVENEGSYYVVVSDNENVYPSIDTSEEGENYNVVEVNEENPTASMTIELKKAIAGYILLSIRDTKDNPIKTGKVVLYKENAPLAEKYIENGLVSFAVKENTKYNVKIDAPGYVIKFVKGISPVKSLDSTPKTIYVEKISKDSIKLIVSVKDEKGEPIEGAKVSLYKGSNNAFIKEAFTDMSGVALFSGIEEGSYYVIVQKDIYEEKSDLYAVSARQENKIEISLKIPLGRIKIKVLDELKSPVKNVVIEAYNAKTKKKLNGIKAITNEEGIGVVEVRADEYVFFKVTSENYAPSYTFPVKADPSNEKELEVLLLPPSPSLKKRFLGIISENGYVSNSSVEPGKKYRLLFAISVPENSEYKKAGFYLRINNEESLEESPAYISKVVSLGKTIKGTTYTPPLGTLTDLENLTSGNAKWIDVSFSNPEYGTYFVEISIVVRESAPTGGIIELHNRAWGETDSGIIRVPYDAELGNSMNSSSKSWLYAKTDVLVLTIGTSSYCQRFFCSLYEIEDNKGIKKAIYDETSIEKNTKYYLNFKIISQNPRTFSKPSLIITPKGGIKIEGYKIILPNGMEIKEEKEKKLIKLEMNKLKNGNIIEGKIEVVGEKSGVGELEINIATENEMPYSKIITFNILAGKKMKVLLVPTVLVPLMKNNVLVCVQDDDNNPLEAFVEVRIDEEKIIYETTNNGCTSFYIPALDIGKKVYFKVYKAGYDSVELVREVKNDIIKIKPNELKYYFQKGIVKKIESEITLENKSSIKLYVEKVKIENNLKEVRILPENIIGKEIDGGKSLKFKLTAISSKETALLEEKDYKGLLVLMIKPILTDETPIEKTWIVSIPITISIINPEGLDERDCIKIYPEKWEIITTPSKEIIKTFEISQECTSNDIPQILKNIYAKLKFSKDIKGSFELSSDLPNAKTIVLQQKEIVFAPYLDSNNTYKITIKYTPKKKIKAVYAEGELIIGGIHEERAGKKLKIEKGIKVSLNVNKLKECISVEYPKPFILEPMPLNAFQGFNDLAFANMLPFMQNNQFGNINYDYYFNGGYGLYSGIGAPPTAGMSAPFMYPGMLPMFPPWSYGSQDQNIQPPFFGGIGFKTFQRNIKIINNCKIDVDLLIIASPALIVSSEKTNLAKGETVEVTISSTIHQGIWPVEIKARPSESEEEYRTVEKINVTVYKMKEMLLNCDCFEVDKKELVFSHDMADISGFLPDRQNITIINKCFSYGLKLKQDGIKLEFFEPEEPGEPFLWESLGEKIVTFSPEYEKTSSGQVIEKMTARITLNPHIDQTQRETLRAALLSRGTMSENLSRIRKYLTGQKYLIDLDARLIIEAENLDRTCTIHLQIKDAMNILALLDIGNYVEFERETTTTTTETTRESEEQTTPGGEQPTHPQTPGEKTRLENIEDCLSVGLSGEKAYDLYLKRNISWDCEEYKTKLTLCEDYFCDSSQLLMNIAYRTNRIDKIVENKCTNLDKNITYDKAWLLFLPILDLNGIIIPGNEKSGEPFDLLKYFIPKKINEIKECLKKNGNPLEMDVFENTETIIEEILGDNKLADCLNRKGLFENIIMVYNLVDDSEVSRYLEPLGEYAIISEKYKKGYVTGKKLYDLLERMKADENMETTIATLYSPKYGAARFYWTTKGIKSNCEKSEEIAEEVYTLGNYYAKLTVDKWGYKKDNVNAEIKIECLDGKYKEKVERIIENTSMKYESKEASIVFLSLAFYPDGNGNVATYKIDEILNPLYKLSLDLIRAKSKNAPGPNVINTYLKGSKEIIVYSKEDKKYTIDAYGENKNAIYDLKPIFSDKEYESLPKYKDELPQYGFVFSIIEKMSGKEFVHYFYPTKPVVLEMDSIDGLCYWFESSWFSRLFKNKRPTFYWYFEKDNELIRARLGEVEGDKVCIKTGPESDTKYYGIFFIPLKEKNAIVINKRCDEVNVLNGFTKEDGDNCKIYVKENVLEITSWKDVFEGVKKGYLCVDKKDRKISIFWNIKALVNER